ncbi:hypothetical protein DOTSEDRAFT_74962 [Dothistroma septosporum NZE10]|uniref:Metal homeostatis protein bsd2 n=1 Tax=Dothistroma septosporum (strain NZE10 / CBS 128990) TaxID=675120 RepID=N1PFH7_DOTSN|nr:hypothetical protein DOTSEDRAFT_74962 [Dothistroma septosporum NZE10]
MSSQRYQPVAAADGDDHVSGLSPVAVPNSPPPSFRSQQSSRRTSREHYHQTADERDLDDAFDAPSDDEDDDDDTRDRRRLMGESDVASPEGAQDSNQLRPGGPTRADTQIPTFTSAVSSGRLIGNSSDGVFANINAKPRAGDDVDEKPPTYEQAAADATPPYWETTVLSPYATTGNPDDVFIDGLLVGSLFSFIWNALISMSFQLIGFLLTYLLHTTHAAKHGSRAGLGITLVQYGFQMRYAASVGHPSDDPTNGAPVEGVPDDPNSHDFDPSKVAGADGAAAAAASLSTTDWLSYALMIVGWFILIRAATDFMKARRQEALVRSSPDRGLGVAVVAENERPETSV